MVVIGIGTAGCKVAKSFSKGHKKILIGPDKFSKTCKVVLNRFFFKIELYFHTLEVP